MARYSLGKIPPVITAIRTKILFTFAGIALYNTIELLVLILVTFKRYSGLYFWSLTISTIGIIPYTLGFLFNFYSVIKIRMITVALIDVGWQLVVTGQSVVMYSRLHLLVTGNKVTRCVMGMIIFNFFICNIPTSVVLFGASSDNPEPYAHLFSIWERLQVVMYFTQESIISGLYIYYVVELLRDVDDRGTQPGLRCIVRKNSVFSQRSRKVLRHLIIVNVFMVKLDVALLVTEFLGLFEVQVLYKTALYSVKLKMEFWILNQLTMISTHRLRQSRREFSYLSMVPSFTSPWPDSSSGPNSPTEPRDVEEMRNFQIESDISPKDEIMPTTPAAE